MVTVVMIMVMMRMDRVVFPMFSLKLQDLVNAS
jgi:hypothetical protein